MSRTTSIGAAKSQPSNDRPLGLSLAATHEEGLGGGANDNSRRRAERRSSDSGRSHAERRVLSIPVWGGATVIEFAVDDITAETTDCIVNPAGPGRVDLAIRRAAGPALLEALHRASRRLPGGHLRPGDAVLTGGFELAPTNVIHCGPPFYLDDPEKAWVDLVKCHVEALQLARANRFASISFPAIGTGVHRYPVEEAAEIAVGTVYEDLRTHAAPALVRFVLFDPATLDVYYRAARALGRV